MIGSNLSSSTELIGMLSPQTCHVSQAVVGPAVIKVIASVTVPCEQTIIQLRNNDSSLLNLQAIRRITDIVDDLWTKLRFICECGCVTVQFLVSSIVVARFAWYHMS